jgi:hypothetical protein
MFIQSLVGALEAEGPGHGKVPVERTLLEGAGVRCMEWWGQTSRLRNSCYVRLCLQGEFGGGQVRGRGGQHGGSLRRRRMWLGDKTEKVG